MTKDGDDTDQPPTTTIEERAPAGKCDGCTPRSLPNFRRPTTRTGARVKLDNYDDVPLGSAVNGARVPSAPPRRTRADTATTTKTRERQTATTDLRPATCDDDKGGQRTSKSTITTAYLTPRNDGLDNLGWLNCLARCETWSRRVCHCEARLRRVCQMLREGACMLTTMNSRRRRGKVSVLEGLHVPAPLE